MRNHIAMVHVFLLFVVLAALGMYWAIQHGQPPEFLIQAELQKRAQALSSHPSVSFFDLSNLSVDHIALQNTLRAVFIRSNLTDQPLSSPALSAVQVSSARELARGLFTSPDLGNNFTGIFHKGAEIYALTPVYSISGQLDGFACLILPLDEFSHASALLRERFLALAAGVTLLALLLAMRLSALLLRPLASASDQTARVAGGDYTQRIPERGPRELAQLAANINAMTEALQKQQDDRRMVLANTTHELARPLGALRLGVDSLLSGALTEPDLAEDLLNEMNQTLRRMEALIDDLSLAARPAGKPVSIDIQCIPVEPVLQGVRSRYWQRAESHGIELQIRVNPATPAVLADELRLNQVIANLVDNALKFTPVNGCVILSACPLRLPDEQPRVEFSVQDTGPGIPSVDLPHVFEPFYQVGNVKGVRQGMGLGLSIVLQLVHAQNGTIELKNLPEGGLLARCIFPACAH